MDDKHPPPHPPTGSKPDYSYEWALLQEGDSTAWESLYEKGFRYVFNIKAIQQWSFDEKEAVFQDAYDLLIDKVRNGNFKTSSNPLNTLKWIAHYKCLAHGRAKGKLQDLPREDRSFDPFEEYEEQSHREKLETIAMDCFQSLDKQERKLLEMTIFERLPHIEVAKILGYAQLYIKVKRKRCMEKLQKCINEKQKVSQTNTA